MSKDNTLNKTKTMLTAIFDNDNNLNQIKDELN